MSFDINITVNGPRCKQYYHQGKTFIEAKDGSEYAIEIKNNHWKRILAVGAVDGLNVLTGKTAASTDSGYIVGGYSSEKIKGFRVSDTEWALFKFGYKMNGNTYAQSKQDGSEKNCGVIGLRFFYEKEVPPIYTFSSNGSGNQWYSNTGTPTYFGGAYNNSTLDFQSYGGKCMSSGVKSRSVGQSTVNYCATVDNNFHDVSQNLSNYEPFNMGTEFGRAEQSKIHKVDFERGNQAATFDIYYASRESLLAMGVPLENKLQVNLPQSFPNEYCSPPKGWRN